VGLQTWCVEIKACTWSKPL